ncbi:hypothetical protein C8T65DRAFT_741065 [Cerioporus squamosus]|nr:hypothetical protein C8T65DRAFT_741065 [Cerioporus squamosus]
MSSNADAAAAATAAQVFDTLVLSILNVLHLALSVTGLQITTDGASDVTAFTAPLTAILISRFLLDLHEANKRVVRLDPSDPLYSSQHLYDTPSFISSLGAFINPDLPAPSDDELEWEEEEGFQASQAAVLSESSSA